MWTILCLFNWKFWSNWSHNWHKLGPMISPHGGDNMLARLEAGVNTFPHISQMKYFCQSFVFFEWESQNVPLYGKTKLWTRAFILTHPKRYLKQPSDVPSSTLQMRKSKQTETFWEGAWDEFLGIQEFGESTNNLFNVYIGKAFTECRLSCASSGYGH